MALSVRLLLAILIAVFSSSIAVAGETLTTVAEWAVLNYTWDDAHTYADYVDSGKFEPSNCLMAGINVGRDGDIYVTVPRWRNGVPATLNKLERSTSYASYTLTPFPSWDMQREGVDGDLQSCQSMTIDTKNRMWVIETGRRNFFSPIKRQWVDGAAGVWIIDLNTNEIVSKYYFPEDVASYDGSYVNDIVLDEKRGLAYLSDAWGEGGIIVYDAVAGTSKRFTGASTTNDPTYDMIINGNDYGTNIFTTPSDGIAFVDDGGDAAAAVFYSAVQGTTLYRLSAERLQAFLEGTATSADLDAAVQVIGTKNPSDGMKYLPSAGRLYYGDLPNSTYWYVPINATSFPDLRTEAVMATPPDASRLGWVDTFAVDLSTSTSTTGAPQKLYFVSNKLDLFATMKMDFSGNSGANMHVLCSDSGAALN
mmetsp:Transcript_26972/g.45491  ORF Transcript_26972/g.45491 Transcript_26972/m.45491 type:complete len:422 (-) Transcript_26972:227-1492(-)